MVAMDTPQNLTYRLLPDILHANQEKNPSFTRHVDATVMYIYGSGNLSTLSGS